MYIFHIGTYHLLKRAIKSMYVVIYESVIFADIVSFLNECILIKEKINDESQWTAKSL